MAININREVEDTFYRYKMPKLTAKVEGKGNGIKTVIVNVSDIAKALSRKPIYVTKYFGCELGAQIHVDDKNERYIVNGAHDATKLQEILDGFIKKFVLCQGCGNPETTMHVSKKSGTVGTTCKACGSQGQLDVTHRLTQYIVKNPPDPEPVVKAKVKKTRKNKNGTDRNSDEDHDASAICDEGTHSPADDADEDWLEDTTEEAQLQRMNELSALAKSLAFSVNVAKSETERADVFYKHLTQLESTESVLGNSREIKAEAERLNLGARAVVILAEVLLRNPTSLVTDVKKYASLFVPFTRIGENQKRAQLYLLGAMTKLIETSETILLPKACHILKALYDNDIVEEDAILAWYEKGPSKKFVSKDLSARILKVCQPLVKWLQEADEEDSEESEEEGSEDAKPIPVALNGREEQVLSAAEETNGSEDEIDIDAI